MNEGAIVRNDQYIFTEWDPTAKGDLEALRTVFDSNGDGVFTAADAKFALFKIEVTNADGTTSVMTLAQAGITSISLKADLTHVQYADGSAITGQTTFTRSNGTTGTVANTTLASESAGYAVTRVVTTDASASRVVTSTAYAADGSIAEVVKTVTSPTGNSITTSFDTNGDGVWDKVQAILTSTVSGVKTEVLTNKNGGNVLLDSKQTITSADGRAATGKARHIVPVARCELRARRASEPPGQTSVSDADVMTMARGKFERRNSLYGWRDYAMAPTVARAPGMAYRSLKLAGAR